MRPSIRIAVLAAAVAWLPSLSLAQGAFDKRIKHWHVAGATSCTAVNRPDYEMNASPYNALYVSVSKQGRWTFTILFWPKALKPGADVPLVFTFGGVKEVKALGKAADDYAMILGNIGPSFRDDVAKASKGEMMVAAEGVTTQLHFDVSDIAAVFAALDECAKTLR